MKTKHRKLKLRVRVLSIFLLVSLIGIAFTKIFLNPIEDSIIIDFTTQLSLFFINLFGIQARASGALIFDDFFEIGINHGCTGIYAFFIYLGATLAFPLPWFTRAGTVLIGVPAIIFINALRIVSIFYIGRFGLEYFDLMHLYVWEPLMIILILGVWYVCVSVFSSNKFSGKVTKRSTTKIRTKIYSMQL